MTSSRPPHPPLISLTGILDIEQLEINLFRGFSPDAGWKRVFGGQVLGQALVAACRTVTGRLPHSLNAYFMLGGDPAVPIIYEVDRIRDGRSFSTRRVVAIQHGEAIFTLSASFQVDEVGHDHQMPMPDVPQPEDLPTEDEIADKVMRIMPNTVKASVRRRRLIELRPVEFERYTKREPLPPRFHVWFRAVEPLGDDPVLQRCALAYASDMTLLDSSMIPHGRSVFDTTIQAASLDHALWLHRPLRVDDWLLYAQDTPSASGARGFARGLVFDRAGRLVASVAQEGLIRPRPDLE